jgi:UDP-2,4-diacetamido-2,4,6-trideoxy-beta-L-altropyranose hydrolase
VTGLLIRADGGIQMGIGHIMRCLALGQAWQDKGGQAAFLMAGASSALVSRLTSEGMELPRLHARPGSDEDALETAAIARSMGATWVVVDGYHFGSAYQQRVRDGGSSLLVIDDYGHTDHYRCDIVLNQNLHADESLYSHRESQTELLLGPRYALLRREFCRWQGWKRTIAETATKVLVTLGGSDPDNATLKVIEALRNDSGSRMKSVVVVGDCNPNYQAIETAAQKHSTEVMRGVTDLPALMAWADVAVSAGGTTCWELAFMGLPSLLLILAENQRASVEELDKLGVAKKIGWHSSITSSEMAQHINSLSLSPLTRNVMSSRGSAMIDGLGAVRVISHMQGCNITLRRARESDCRLLWDWANDATTRAFSFSSTPISWEEHREWFASKLDSSSCILYIIIDSDQAPVGQLRCDICQNEATVSISLDKRFRGMGYGSTALKEGTRELFSDSSANLIHAYVKSDNESSLHAFTKAGFQQIGVETIRDSVAAHFVCKKADIV